MFQNIHAGSRANISIKGSRAPLHASICPPSDGRQHADPVSSLQVNLGPRYQQKEGWGWWHWPRSLGSLSSTSCLRWEPKDPREGQRPPNQRDCLHKSRPRLALAIFLNHLWFREVDCLLVSSSKRIKPVATVNMRENLESTESIRNQNDFPLSSGEIGWWHNSEFRATAPGSGHGFSDWLLSQSSHVKTIYEVMKDTGTGVRLPGSKLCHMPSDNGQAI